MRATDLSGRTVAPGEIQPLDVEVDLPDIGVETHAVRVFHDADQHPVSLTVEAVGRKEPPYVVSAEPKRVTFFEVAVTEKTASLRVVACEPAGSHPWLGPLTCDIPEVTVDLVRRTDKPSGRVVLRTYEYRIGWSSLPRGHEFSGMLWAHRNGDPGSGVLVSTIAGTRARR